MNFQAKSSISYCIIRTEETSCLRGFRIVWSVAFLADQGLYLAALAVGIACLRAGLGEVCPVDIDVCACGEYLVVESWVSDCGGGGGEQQKKNVKVFHLI